MKKTVLKKETFKRKTSNLLRAFETIENSRNEKYISEIQTTIAPREFLNAINMFNSHELYKTPKDTTFKKIIDLTSKNNKSTINEKAANLLYLMIKKRSFEKENRKNGVICFLYYLSKHNRLNAITEKKKEILYLIILIIEKSSVSEKRKILSLIQNLIFKN